MESEIILGTEGYRGTAHLARLLLHYTGANWSEKRYSAEAQEFNKVKNELNLNFPKLPYLIHGTFKITESLALYRYIISISDKQDLLGRDLKDQTMVDNIEGVYLDLRTPITKLFYSENFKAEAPAALEGMKKKLGLLQKFYGENRLALGYLTLPDLELAELAYYIRALSEETYSAYPFLEAVRSAVSETPEIESYYGRPDALKVPFMPPTCNIAPQM